MYPALNGDCFLLQSDSANILFDGGYTSTFEDHLRVDLQDLSNHGRRLDLLVGTHIDQDHILGLIAFLEENGPTQPRKVIEVDDLWFNSLRCLASQLSTPIPKGAIHVVKALARQGFIAASTSPGVNKISARQGSTLGALIRRNGYLWNGGNGGHCIQQHCAPLSLSGDASVQVLGPSQQRLDDLRRFWTSALTMRGYTGPFGSNDDLDEAFEIVCNRAPGSSSSVVKKISAGAEKLLSEVYEPDKSVTNGSSISVVVTADGARILLLADAWAEDTVDALKTLQANGESMLFDAIKVSHHGSLQNTSPELLGLIDAPIYLISSNGSIHEHPDVEVARAIVDRPSAFERALHFNYATPASASMKLHVSASGAKFKVHETSTDWIEIKATQ